MPNMRMTTRRRVAVAAAGLVAVVAMPVQAGIAHASTPQDDLSACLISVADNAKVDLSDDASTDITDAVDNCVNAFLQAMSIDISPAPATVDAPPDDNAGAMDLSN